MSRSTGKIITRTALAIAAAALCFIAGAHWGRPMFPGLAPRHARGSSTTAHFRAGPSGVKGTATTTSTPSDSPALAMWAEFDRQPALLIGASETLKTSPKLLADLARLLHRDITLVGLVKTDAEARLGRTLLDRYFLPRSAMQFVVIPHNSSWVRDFGPLFVQRADGSPLILDPTIPRGKRGEFKAGNENLPAEIARRMGLPCRKVDLIVEGGNLLTNGDGLVLTSTTFIGRNVDKGLTKDQIGQMLNREMGFRQWVHLRLPENEPTQHVDMFVAFLATDLAVVAEMDPRHDADAARVLDAAAATLRGQPTNDGPMRVYRIPMPGPTEGRWRSYTNIILADDVLVMPRYSDADPDIQRRAREVYLSLCPRRRVVEMSADRLIKGNGSLHCFTQHIPGFVPVESIEKLLAATDGK
ncbi:MAG: agmatine deiminase family protein [Phycisphaerae bacterium]